MNKLDKYFITSILLQLLMIVILLVGFSGCDNVRCYPHFKPDGTYLGIKCGGEW